MHSLNICTNCNIFIRFRFTDGVVPLDSHLLKDPCLKLCDIRIEKRLIQTLAMISIRCVKDFNVFKNGIKSGIDNKRRAKPNVEAARKRLQRCIATRKLLHRAKKKYGLSSTKRRTRLSPLLMKLKYKEYVEHLHMYRKK